MSIECTSRMVSKAVASRVQGFDEAMAVKEQVAGAVAVTPGETAPAWGSGSPDHLNLITLHSAKGPIKCRSTAIMSLRRAAHLERR